MSQPPDPVTTLSPLKRALLALDDMKARLDASERARREPIAIVGMGCRFPGGANDPDQFWRVLHEGIDAVTPVPKERWNADLHFDPDPNAPGKAYVRCGSFVDAFDRFDPQFFGIAPREAAGMDPQQRLLLEVAWEALEDAAVSPERAAGTAVGVFVGINSMDYAAMQLQRGEIEKIDAYSLSGTSHSIAAGRLAYVLGLCGPAMAVDTACSSSLVALHLACQSLRNDECRMALAGGVQLTLSPMNSVVFSKLKMLAADGRCKTFDARGDGFVEGEGCAVLVLKRLSDALADGDRVIALVRSSAVNQDGASSGLTAPNGPSQEAVIRAALARGGVRPAEVDYVEAHGTGTALGDPIEVQALAAVLGEGRPPERPLLIGSVKTNLGHTQAAAGVAGVAKLALALDREEIPRSLHFEQPNPHIPWSALPVKVVTEPVRWPRRSSRRLGGVSSFGFSGTNVHVILEEAPLVEPKPAASERPLHVQTVSARTEAALRAQAGRWAARMRADAGATVADVAFSANSGRAHLPERAAFVAGTRDEALAHFDALAAGGVFRGARGRAPLDRPKVAFLCTGQGAQYAGMGKQLFETQPTFRRAIEACAALFDGELPEPLLSVMHPAGGAASPIDQTIYAQPALFAIEYALSELWKSWGVVPSAVLGHSIGEYVAAHLAGVMTLEDAAKLVALRGRLMQSLPSGGAMAAVFAAEDRVRTSLAGYEERVAIAAVNAPQSVVISGTAAAIDELLARFDAVGISSERLTVSHAFHSPLMDPILDEFTAAAGRVALSAPALALVSNLTGQLARDEIRTAAYWRRHLREPVLFGRGVATLRDLGFALFVELGPRPTLSGLAARSLGAGAAVLPSLRKPGHDWSRLLESLAELYVRGAEVDWAAFDGGYGRRKLALPTYPFERERHWLPGLASDPVARRGSRAGAPDHPLLGSRLSSALEDVQFESELSVQAPAFLADHCKRGTPVLPATAYLEMGLSAAMASSAETPLAIDELIISEPLVLSADPVCVQTILKPAESGSFAFRLFSREDAAPGGRDRWRLHATGSIVPAEASVPGEPLDAIRARCTGALAVDEWYEQLRKDGHEYGPAFRAVSALWRGDWEALGEVKLSSEIESEARAYQMHPALLDAALQVLAAAVPATLANADGTTYLPVSLGRCRVHVRGASAGWSHVRLTPPAESQPDGFSADVRLYDADGRLIAEVQDIYHKRMSADALDAAARKSLASWLYETAWRPEPRANTSGTLEGGAWIVIADRESPLAADIARRFEERGIKSLQALDGDEAIRLLTQVSEPGRPTQGVVLVAGTASQAANPVEPHAAAQRECDTLLHLVQAIGAGTGARPRLAVATCGAVAVDNAAKPVAFWQASLLALARTIPLEHHDLPCVSIDLDPAPAAGDVDMLVAELLAPDPESQVAIRHGLRHVARLTTSAAAADPGATPPVSLEIGERGVLDRLEFRPLTRRPPGPGEVELRIKTAALNFRDVLNALGVYQGDAGPLGNECVATVVAVGRGVEHLKVGDDVFGMAPGTFRSYVTAPAGPLIVKPPSLSDEDAAAIPIAFLTADFALNTLGRMRPGERVLIHAAAGGVGLAAVALARRAGAEIFATAGSREKHEFLRSLGVKHIFSSRTLQFADQILELTGGRGVDVVLNSLTGEFIDKSVAVLARGGRFLEIGKAGIWTSERMAEARPDVAYHPIYFSPDDHPRVRQQLSDLTASVVAGELELPPRRSFPAREAVAAFRYMAQARHIGKIVLVFDDSRAVADRAVRPDRAYLVTGGLGALGLSVARWMVRAGAKHLVLASRNRPSDEAASSIAALQEQGADVVVVQADVSRRADVTSLLGRISRDLPPLAGIVHAAGVVDDGLLVQQTSDRLAGVMAPKAAGAWHLHEETRTVPLDFFVLFSSMASLFGGPGQGTYAAANGFLDGLAAHRRAQGLAGVSVQWGPWDGAGMAARVSMRDRQRWEAQGFGSIATADGVHVLEHLIKRRTSATIAVLPVDWRTWLRQFPDGEPPFLREMAARYAGRSAAPQAPRRNLAAEAAAVPPNRRRGVFAAFLREEALKVLGLDPSTAVDVREPLHDLGLDSLMAVELRNTIASALGRPLPATLLFKHPTLQALEDFVITFLQGAGAPEVTAASPDDDARDAVSDLTDEETKKLLAEELRSLALAGLTPEDGAS
jgi:acyl transferase domain-containing protein/acyl carrier protein